MSTEWEQLERLISRELDGECTPQQRRRLQSMLRESAQARARYEEMRAIDRAARDALRAALGRSPDTLRLNVQRPGWARGLLVAVAAGIAALVWLQAGEQTPRVRPSPARPLVEAGSDLWRLPRPATEDVVQPVPAAFERPELRWRGTQREWILIPADRPNTYMLIEMDQVRTRVIGVHRDY